MAARKKVTAPSTPEMLRMFGTDIAAMHAIKMYFQKPAHEREQLGFERWIEGYLRTRIETHYSSRGQRLHWNRGKMVKQLRVLTHHLRRRMAELTAPREC